MVFFFCPFVPEGMLGIGGEVGVSGISSEESAGGLTGELAGPLTADETEQIQVIISTLISSICFKLMQI